MSFNLYVTRCNPAYGWMTDHQNTCRKRSIALKEYNRREHLNLWVAIFKNCPKKWKTAINLRNGLLFSEHVRPKIIRRYSTSCFHEDYTTELYCPKSIQKIRNCESRHYSTETSRTIQTLTEETAWQIESYCH